MNKCGVIFKIQATIIQLNLLSYFKCTIMIVSDDLDMILYTYNK